MICFIEELEFVIGKVKWKRGGGREGGREKRRMHAKLTCYDHQNGHKLKLIFLYQAESLVQTGGFETVDGEDKTIAPDVFSSYSFKFWGMFSDGQLLWLEDMTSQVADGQVIWGWKYMFFPTSFNNKDKSCV